MSVTLDNRPELAEPAARAIRTAIDLGDGGTAKQRELLQVILEEVWGRPDLLIDELEPITPEEVATLFDSPVARSRLQRLLVMFEFCRYPFTEEQVDRIDSFHDALGDTSVDGIEFARQFVNHGIERTVENVNRRSAALQSGMGEVSLNDRYSEIDMLAPDLTEVLRRFAELPPGTLGREYFEFYMRHDFELPGQGYGSPAFFVRHDMMHVLTGYGPTSPEELALAAFQVGMRDNEENWNSFVVAMAALELGLYNSDTFEGKSGILDRDGAMRMMVAGFLRGTQCATDVSELDHLGLAPVPVEELRRRFAIPPMAV